MSDSCDPKDYSLPGFSVRGILQARILEWVAITFSKGSSWCRNWTRVSCIAGRFFTDWKILYQLLMWCITWIDLYILDNPFISVINLIWLWCMILFMPWQIQFASVLLKIFTSMFISNIGLQYSFLWYLCFFVSGWWWPHIMSFRISSLCNFLKEFQKNRCQLSILLCVLIAFSLLCVNLL